MSELKKKIVFLDHSTVLGGAELSLLDILMPPPEISTRVKMVAVAFGEGQFLDALQKTKANVITINASKSFLAIKREGGLIGALHGLKEAAILAKKVKKIVPQFDVIHCNTQKAFVVGCMLRLITGKTLTWHLRDILTTEHFSRVQILLAVTLSRIIGARVIANSNATADAFKKAGGSSRRLKVIYNGIDSPPSADFPEPLPLNVAKVLSENKLVIGVFGRISPWKGQDLAIAALREIPGSHLLIVGAALFGENDYEKKIRDQAQSLGIADRVHFLGFQSNVWPLMRACRYIVHTSTQPEPFGRVLVEGMLCEKVVLAPSVGGPCEIIDHLKTGILYEPRSAQDLSQWIRRLESDTALREYIEKNASREARVRFGKNRMIAEVFGELTKL